MESIITPALQAIMIVLTIGAGLWGFTRYVLNKVENTAEACRQRDEILHQRINDTRDDYLTKDDFDKHMSRLGDDLKEMRMDMKANTNQISTRLDLLIAKMGAKHNG